MQKIGHFRSFQDLNKKFYTDGCGTQMTIFLFVLNVLGGGGVEEGEKEINRLTDKSVFLVLSISRDELLLQT